MKNTVNITMNQKFCYLRTVKMGRVHCLLAVFLNLLWLFNCAKTDTKSGDATPLSDTTIVIRADTNVITIVWDKSDVAGDTVDYYDVYYSVPGDTVWRLVKGNLKTASAQIARSDIATDDTIFYFGVQSVSKLNKKSKIHTSRDTTSFPQKWMIHWTGQ